MPNADSTNQLPGPGRGSSRAGDAEKGPDPSRLSRCQDFTEGFESEGLVVSGYRYGG
jgi:hypothetical protein